MDTEKTKPKRTTSASVVEEPKEEKKASKKESSKTAKKESSRIIWLYGAHQAIIKSATNRILNYGSKASNQFRSELGLGMDDLIIPIDPYPASKRLGILKQLSKLDGAVFLVPGLLTDRKNKALHKHYKDTEVVWTHPQERQFHIDMMRASGAISFSEATEIRSEWTEFFADHFSIKNRHAIRI